MLLYGIGGTYQPAVQASLPVLCTKENLIKANAVVNQISTLSSILGPVLGGVLYGIYGIKIVLFSSVLCFFASAVMEIFIYIPYHKQKMQGSFLSIAIKDFKESLKFVIKDTPVVAKIIVILAFLNLFQTSLLLVAMPVVVTQVFRMSEATYGYGQGMVGIGGLVGGIFTSIMANKLKFQKSYLFLIMATLCLFPIGIIIYLRPEPMLATWIIIPFCAFMVAVATIFMIQMLSFVQRATPENLIGKVISCVLMLSMCAQPIRQAVYGFLIESCENQIYLLFWGAAIVNVLIAVFAKTVFAGVKDI